MTEDIYPKFRVLRAHDYGIYRYWTQRMNVEGGRWHHIWPYTFKITAVWAAKKLVRETERERNRPDPKVVWGPEP